MSENEGSWAQWCKYVLLELEAHHKEIERLNNKVVKCCVMSIIVQTQLLCGAVALGYLIKVLVDHIMKG